MYSHRSETYTVLVVILFLNLHNENVNIPFSNPVKYYCDNEEAVDKISNIRKDTNNYVH